MTLPIPNSDGATFRNNINTEFSTVVSTDVVEATTRSTADSTEVVNRNTAISTANSGDVKGVNVSTIWQGTQVQFDAISPKDSATIYYIVG